MARGQTRLIQNFLGVVMFYICTRSLRNGALSFVSKYSDQQKAKAIADMANYGRFSNGPTHSLYVVISAL
jgi:hypothetical protein